MAILDNAIWLTGAGASPTAVSGSTVISEAGNSTTVTGTFTANAWDASQSGYAVSQFGAFGITSPITANYQFSNLVENLSFTLEHVSSSGTTYDDEFTLYIYDESGTLIPSADVIAGLTGVTGATIYANPDGSVVVEADNTAPENIVINISGYKVSELNVIFDVGPDGTQTGGAGLGDLSFSILPPLDDIVEGTGANDVIDVNYTGDPEGDRIDNSDSTGAQTGNPGSNDDYILAGAGNDNVRSSVGADEVYGGTGNDTLRGQGGSDSLYGEDGNDFLLGGGGTDTLDGGAGNDSLFGGGGSDVLSGGTGNDSLNGGNRHDTLTGGAGDDTFIVSSGRDVITDFGTGNTGAIDDGVQTNNDFVDLSSYYSQANYDAAVLAGDIDPLVILSPLQWMKADLADDGILNDTNAGWDTANTLTIQNGGAPVGPADLSFDTTNVVCFVADTMIATDVGERKIQDLVVGDLVETMDSGYQPIRWIGSKSVLATGNLAPIQIAAGCLGNARDQRVSPQHRILISGWQAEMCTGQDEVLVSAKHLMNGTTIHAITGGEVEYFHILFDQHEIIFAEGSPTESFHPGKQGLSGLDEDTRQELYLLFPELAVESYANCRVTARLCLKQHEASVLVWRLFGDISPENTKSGAAIC